MRVNWSTERKTRAIFAVVGVLVVIVGTFSYQNARSFIDTNALIASTQRILKEEDDVLIALSNVEAYQFAYLATGDETYREQYDAARMAVLDHMATLRNLLRASVVQMERLDTLTPLIATKLAIAESSIALRRAGLDIPASSFGASAVGKNLTDEIHRIFDTMIAQSNQVLDVRTARSDNGAQFTLATVAVLTLLMIISLGFSYFFIHREFAGRTRFEHLLQQERTLLRTVIDTLPDNIYVKDPELHFILGNRAQAALVGVSSPDALVGKSDADFFPAEHVAHYATDERAILRSGEPLLNHEELIINNAGEEVTMLTTKIPMRSPAGTITQIVGISHDITSRKKEEAEIQLLNENLRQQTKELEAANRELQAFTYSVSHDLRAPLRAIDGFSRIIIQDYGAQLPPEGIHYLDKVRGNAKRMGNLIDDLLYFSRVTRQAIRKQPVEPGALVQRILNEDFRSERDDRHVIVEVGTLPVAQADPQLLRQVYMNLISNAFKFTLKQDNPHIEIGAKRENGNVVYFVKDNGAGFDEKYMNKLFGVFQRLHHPDDYEGTGVGLAIVQRVVHRHGGQVWAEGAVNQGATFYFTLGDLRG